MNIPLPGPRLGMQASAKQLPYKIKYINELRGLSERTPIHHTCFQRKPCRPNLPPPSRRKRSKPTRTVTSNRMSMMSVTMRASLTPLRSLGTHTRFSGTDHTKRTCRGNKREPETTKNGYHPCYSCPNMFSSDCMGWSQGGDLPWRRKATLVTHKQIAILTTAFL